MTNIKCEYNEEIGHYGQTLTNAALIFDMLTKCIRNLILGT
jgi:hypothetical protein